MWFEIKTGSVECRDEVEDLPVGNHQTKSKQKSSNTGDAPFDQDQTDAVGGTREATQDEEDLEMLLASIGAVEQSAPTLRTRITVRSLSQPSTSESRTRSFGYY